MTAPETPGAPADHAYAEWCGVGFTLLNAWLEADEDDQKAVRDATLKLATEFEAWQDQDGTDRGFIHLPGLADR